MSHTDDLSDFRNFLYLAFVHLGHPPTPKQYKIAYWLQHSPARVVLQAFRGMGKTWIVGVFVCWLLYMDPQKNIIIVSASKQHGDNIAKFAKNLIETMPLLQHLRPGPGQRSAATEFDVAGAGTDVAPSVRSAGITGMITGGRADLVVGDDIETPDNSDTLTMREKIRNKVKEFDSILKPGGRVVYIGTPQTEETLYEELRQRGYDKMVWTARYPSAKQIEDTDFCVAQDILDDLKAHPELEGTSLEPTRFSELDLQNREASVGRTTFALQFMLSTKMKDAELYPFRMRDLSFYTFGATDIPDRVMWNNDPDNCITEYDRSVAFKGDRPFRGIVQKDALRTPFQGVYMAVDPSGNGTDETAYAVVGYLNAQMFLIDCGGFLDGYGPATLSGLAEIAKKYKVNRILCEPNYGGGMFTKMLQPVVKSIYGACSVEDAKWSKGNKEKRICAVLQPVIGSHKLIVNTEFLDRDYKSTASYTSEGSIKYQLFYQLTHVRPEPGALAKDDRLEAVSMAVNAWTEAMSQSTDEETAKAKDRLWKQEISRFKQYLVGEKKPKAQSWGRRN